MMCLTVPAAPVIWAGITATSSPAPLLAQAAGGGLVAFLPLVLIMVIFYVLLILPAQKRQKKTAAMQQALKNGDKVLTSGGVYGTIAGLEETAVLVRVAEQVKLRVARSAIVEILEPDAAKEIQ
jgi:preprotein translocase subunit YajC